MFGFRRIAYMLLSRHFWVGLGVGVALSGLLATSLASADTTLFNHATTSGATSLGWSINQNLIIASTTLQYYEALGKRIDFIILQTGNSGCSSNNYRWSQNGVNLATSTQASYITSCQNSTPRHAMAVPEYDSQYNLVVTNYQGNLTNGLKSYWNGVSIASRPDFVLRNDDGSGNPSTLVYGGYTWLADIATSTGGGATSTVFYPLGLNAMIDDMNCVNSATGTDCTFIYSSLTPFTLQNIVLLTLLFLLFGFIGYWLIKTFW